MTEFPLLKDALYQIWLKLVYIVVPQNKLLKCRQCIFAISIAKTTIYKKNMALHFNKLEPTSPKDALCQVSLVEIGPSGSGEYFP